MTVERVLLFVLFWFFGNLFFPPCQTQGQERERQPPQWTFQGKEYTRISPDNLCPFTVDVYPEELYVGDPLYVRLKFKNNTDRDTYAPAEILARSDLESYIVSFYLICSGEVLPLAVASGYSDGMLNKKYVWQKIKQGDEGLTQYMFPGFPGITCGAMPMFLEDDDHEPFVELWQETRGADKVRRQLMVIINNKGDYLNQQRRFQSIASISSPIIIKPRQREEMAILETWLLRDLGDLDQGQLGSRLDLEQIIPKLTQGTLQNLLKYQLLLVELKEEITLGEDGRREMSRIHVFEMLGKINFFLQSIPEIERENLKRCVGDIFTERGERTWLEGVMADYGEKHLERFLEVFGKGHVFSETPGGYMLFPAGTGTHRDIPEIQRETRRLIRAPLFRIRRQPRQCNFYRRRSSGSPLLLARVP